MATVKIDIPKSPDEAIDKIQPGLYGELKAKFQKIDQVVFGIIIVLLFSLVAIIISIAGIFLDQMRYNNAAYKDYSEKIELIDFGQNANKELFEQNKLNQKLILEQQEQILKLLAP